MTKLCDEQILRDIVRVEIVKADDCNLPVPMNANTRAITYAKGELGSAVCAFAISADDDSEEMSQQPTLKISVERAQGGTIYTHEYSIDAAVGEERAREIVDILQDIDFHVVYTASNGARMLSYTLFNASQATIEESLGASSSSTTLKLKIMSASNVIALTETTE